mmetsp:Transcript_9406/g.18084  ORF Transcript_9406/g.18084 Transcript_9406/m.18084 type:complete len:304 (+) Transcript_9406:426-1337(+)
MFQSSQGSFGPSSFGHHQPGVGGMPGARTPPQWFNPWSSPNPYGHPMYAPGWTSSHHHQFPRPKPTIAKPQYSCDLNLTLESKERQADVTIKLNSRHLFKINHEALRKFIPDISGELFDNAESTMSVECPFEEAFLHLLMFIASQDHFIFTRFTQAQEKQLELYAAAHALGLGADSKFADLLASLNPSSGGLFGANFPGSNFGNYHAWSRHYIDFEYALKLLRSNSNPSAPWLLGVTLLEWLDEKNLTTAEQQEELLASEDFAKVRNFWKSAGGHPQLFNMVGSIVHAYPVASQAISIRCLFP